MKKYKRLLRPIILLIIFGATVTLVSIEKFNVDNPFAVVNELFQITFTDKQYVEIQAYPKVMLAKSGVSLNDYEKLWLY